MKQRMQPATYNINSMNPMCLRGTCAETEDATSMHVLRHPMDICLIGTGAETEDAISELDVD